MDEQDAAAKKTLELAMLSLDGLLRIRTRPEDLGPSLWPCAWKWYFFFQTHWDNLPFVPGGEVSFCTEFLFFAGSFGGGHETTRALMMASPGFRVMLGKALSFVPRLKRLPVGLFEMVMNHLGDLLLTEAVPNVALLEEVIAGAGGTLQDLGKAVIQYFQEAIRRKKLFSVSNTPFIRGTLAFIHNADAATFSPDEKADKRDPYFSPIGSFCRSLIPEGIIFVILAAVKYLTKCSDMGRGEALNSCFGLLTRYMNAPSGRNWLEVALRNDLLPIMTTCATLDCAEDLEGNMLWFLNKILHRGLVYHDVVAQLKRIKFDDSMWESLSEDSEDWDGFYGNMYMRFDLLKDSKTLPRLFHGSRRAIMTNAVKSTKSPTSFVAVDARHSITAHANAIKSTGISTTTNEPATANRGSPSSNPRKPTSGSASEYSYALSCTRTTNTNCLRVRAAGEVPRRQPRRSAICTTAWKSASTR
ncbi:hypothetical protein B0H16DRAFT_1003292 [Mycena metata]|uniref:Uncharacterized protein n=1 Tax=Mycena metata TaxID=1033252 RepID=A0AAD7NUY6_9AGAR|nr:hypothetical protein B0H16DRAFT_1003292 [Mycena metata]